MADCSNPGWPDTVTVYRDCEELFILEAGVSPKVGEIVCLSNGGRVVVTSVSDGSIRVRRLPADTKRLFGR